MIEKVTIEIELENAAFEDDLEGELTRILSVCTRKVLRQSRRSPDTVCTAAESDDVLLDINGNTVGTIALVRGESEDD